MSDDFDDDDSEASGGFDIAQYLRWFADGFRTYHFLLWILLIVFIATCLVMIANSKPDYTATAVVGPSVSLDAMSNPNSIQGVAKKLKVGGLLGQAGDNGGPFDEFVALLTSSRLAERLSKVPGLMPKIFWDQWDSQNSRWYPTGNATLDRLRGMLHRPIKPSPDSDDLKKYISDHLTVNVSLQTSFATVAFDYKDRSEAENLLNTILFQADSIIRDDKRRDVAARIAYLTRALDFLTNTDEKKAISDTLSDQQQDMTMIESDQRYATTLIDPPHAPFRPTAPNPTEDMIIAVAMAVMTWCGLVYLAKPGTRVYRIMQVLVWPSRRNRFSQPVTRGEQVPSMQRSASTRSP